MVALENNLLEVGDNKLFQGGSKRMVRLEEGPNGAYTIPGLGVNFTYTQRGEENIFDENASEEDFQKKRRFIDNQAPPWANAFFYDGGELDKEAGVFSIRVDYFKIPEGEIRYALRLLTEHGIGSDTYKEIYAALTDDGL